MTTLKSDFISFHFSRQHIIEILSVTHVSSRIKKKKNVSKSGRRKWLKNTSYAYSYFNPRNIRSRRRRRCCRCNIIKNRRESLRRLVFYFFRPVSTIITVRTRAGEQLQLSADLLRNVFADVLITRAQLGVRRREQRLRCPRKSSEEVNPKRLTNTSEVVVGGCRVTSEPCKMSRRNRAFLFCRSPLAFLLPTSMLIWTYWKKLILHKRRRRRQSPSSVIRFQRRCFFFF